MSDSECPNFKGGNFVHKILCITKKKIDSLSIGRIFLLEKGIRAGACRDLCECVCVRASWIHIRPFPMCNRPSVHNVRCLSIDLPKSAASFTAAGFRIFLSVCRSVRLSVYLSVCHCEHEQMILSFLHLCCDIFKSFQEVTGMVPQCRDVDYI